MNVYARRQVWVVITCMRVGGEMVVMVMSERARGEMLVGGDGGGREPACMRGDVGGGRWSWWL